MAPAPAPKPSPTTLTKIPATMPPAVSSVWELTPVLLLPTQLALIDPTMMARAMIVPTAEIRAATRPAMVAAPMVPPPLAVTKPAAPMSPRKTRNASKPSGAGCDRGRDAGKHRPGGAHDKGEPGQAEDQNKR